MKRLRRVLVRQIVPPLRAPVTVRQVVPLSAFFAVYCGRLHRPSIVTGHVLFVRPRCSCVMIVSVWVWWMYVAGYSRIAASAGDDRISRADALGRRRLPWHWPSRGPCGRATCCRSSTPSTMSDSIGESSTDSALQFLAQTVTQKPEKDQAGLVVFGRNAAAELPPRQSFPFDSASVSINSQVDRDATNIEQALSLAGGHAAGGQPGPHRAHFRRNGDRRKPVATFSTISNRGESPSTCCRCSTTTTKEVWLERLDLPRFVKIGENYEAAIVLSSLQTGSGRLVVREQGQRDLGADGRLPGGQKPLQRPDQAARAGLLRILGHDRNAPRQPTISSRTTPSSITCT